MSHVPAELEAKLTHLVELSKRSGKIDLGLYTEYDVKRGLRDTAGRGVLTGLTEISDLVSFHSDEDGEIVPVDGEIYYQGYDVVEMVKELKHQRFGFEETTYLLLFGQLPTKPQLKDFIEILEHFRELPNNFVRDIIMKASSKDVMNALQRSVLTLYSYDEHPDDLSIPNILRQSLNLIAKMPLLAVYSYHTYRHYHKGENLVIRNPKEGLSYAENLLQMLHADGKYTELEAKVLDILLILHAEHGGGNNSTFTTHVVSSTGTDTYSAVAASLGSLKGPKHGGANLKVQGMFGDIKDHIKDWNNKNEIEQYLMKMLDKKAYDHTGLIYGMGHAVYTISDPRAVVLKQYAEALAKEKGLEAEYKLYNNVEEVAGICIAKKRRILKPVCANVDFYSGFVYTMLGIPKELYTPMFAVSRISGWSAHRIEELVNDSKIIRPAYKYIGHHRDFVKIEDRN